jgi:hypothetical protein
MDLQGGVNPGGTSAVYPARSPGYPSSDLPVRQKGPQLSNVAFGDDVGLAQSSFPLGGFLRQNVIGMGLGKCKFSTSCFLESFGCGAIGFDLWHVLNS